LLLIGLAAGARAQDASPASTTELRGADTRMSNGSNARPPAEMPLPTMPGYRVRFAYRDCDDVQRCWLQLELVSPEGRSIATAQSGHLWLLGNDAVLSKERAHLGPSLDGPSWELNDRSRELTLGMVVFALDPRTSGLAFILEGEGADYQHRLYEVWAFALTPHPAVWSVLKAGVSDGPFWTQLQLQRAGGSVQVATVEESYLKYDEKTGRRLPDSIDYSVRVWRPSKRRFTALPAEQRSRAPLFAVVAATFAQASTAWAFVERIHCGVPVGVFATGDTALLRPGAFFVGNYFQNEQEARSSAASFRRCAPQADAYIKRAF
jgi:hypothetical protein